MVTIQGAGASFPAPLSKRLIEFYLVHPNVRVNYYQAIGSGAGVNQFPRGPTNFAVSDSAMKWERLDEVALALSDREQHTVELIQAPLTGGAIDLCYDLPTNPDLKLTRQV
jgi:phosphate transport system substrate-binding protein